MVSAPYTVLVTYPKPSVPDRVRRWLGYPCRARAVKVWPLCPVCAQPVKAWTPQIRQGDEFYDELATYKNPDEVVGFILRPCGHGVEHVAMMKATTD